MDDVHKCLGMLQKLALTRTDETSIPHRIRMLPSIEPLCQKISRSEVEVARQKITDYYVDILISTGPPTSDVSKHTEMVREIRNIHSVFRSRYIAGHLENSTLQKFIKASYFLTLWSTHLGYVLDDVPQMAIEAASHLPVPRARCLLAQCGVYRRSERFEEAEQCCRQALSVFQDAGDLSGQGDAISMLSGIFDDRGEPRRGEETSSQTRDLATLSRKRQKLDEEEESWKTQLAANETNPNIPRWQTALIHLQLGTPTIYMTRARLDSTIDSLDRALQLYEKDRNYLGQATALFHTACAYLLKNQISYARAIVERSLGICSQIVTQVANYGLPSSVGMIFNELTSESEMQAFFLTLLGHIYIREDRLVEAKTILKKAVKQKAAYSLIPVLRLGWLYLRQNKLDKAEKTFNDLRKRCRALRCWDEENETLGYQGIIHLRRGNLDAAEATLKESRKRGLLLYSEIDVLQVLGDVYIQKNQLQIAEEILAHAMRIQNQIDSASGQGNVLRSMGDLHARRQKFAEALAAYEAARTFHRAAHWTSEEMEDVERIALLHRRHGKTRAAEEAIAEVRRMKALIS
jgi:tetratricopeptide (TPR) repeat protein